MSGRRSAEDRDRLGGRHATALRRGDDAEPSVDAADHQIVVTDLDRLAGLDDGPFTSSTERAEQRRPRPEIRPADIHRRHRDFAVARRALHHGMVDGERRADRLVGVGQLVRRAEHRLDGLDEARVPHERGSDRPPAPEEHARVPGGAFGAFEQVLGSIGLGLLLERLERIRTDRICWIADVRAAREVRQQVAVFDGRADHLRAKGHEGRVDLERPRREIARRRSRGRARRCPRARDRCGHRPGRRA